MKSPLKGRQVYVDTNILVYIATGHPEFYKSCLGVLELVSRGEVQGLGSHLVLFELFGALSKLNVQAAYEAAEAYLSLPIKIVTPSRRTLRVARDIAKLTGVTYDSLHASLAAEGGAEVVVTEDLEHWSRIASAWDRIAHEHGFGELRVFSPTRGFL